MALRGVNIDSYPSVKAHLQSYREKLEPKPADWNEKDAGKWLGRKPGKYKWYEIQDSIQYHALFDEPKIFFQQIQFHSSFAFDDEGLVGNNKTTFIPTKDFYILGLLASPLIWWFNWRYLPHMKDEALAPVGKLMDELPIAETSNSIQVEIVEQIAALLDLTKSTQQSQTDLLDWIKTEMAVEKPGNMLSDAASITSDDFLAEIRKRRPKGASKLGVGDVKRIREAYNEIVPDMRNRNAEILKHEHRLSDLVNEAYGLTPEEIELMWKTAPPRMPFSR